MKNKRVSVPEDLAGVRFDLILSTIFKQYSRAALQNWIKQGKILVNGHPRGQKEKLAHGDIIDVIELTPQRSEKWTAQDIKLDLIYEDPDILIINKPAGLVVHPGAGNHDGTLVNALIFYDEKLSAVPRAGIVHRIDKDTSGLLVVARNLKAHTSLIRQMQQRSIKREYLTVVNGVMTGGGTIDAPIGRHKTNRLKMTVRADGRAAITHYRLRQRYKAHTELQVRLETGRTHQIRVHMQHIKHPLVGDKSYSGRFTLPKNCAPKLATVLNGFKRQALHAQRLEIEHPATEEKMSWQVAPPRDMQELIDALAAKAVMS